MTTELLLLEWEKATEMAEATDNWEVVSKIELELIRRKKHPHHENYEPE